MPTVFHAVARFSQSTPCGKIAMGILRVSWVGVIAALPSQSSGSRPTTMSSTSSTRCAAESGSRTRLSFRSYAETTPRSAPGPSRFVAPFLARLLGRLRIEALGLEQVEVVAGDRDPHLLPEAALVMHGDLEGHIEPGAGNARIGHVEVPARSVTVRRPGLNTEESGGAGQHEGRENDDEAAPAPVRPPALGGRLDALESLDRKVHASGVAR